jgi:hypothetical protein
MTDSKRSEKYGYLYRGVQERFYWFRILQFPTNMVLALQGVLAANIGLRTFLASMLFLLNGVAVGVFWPFKGWVTNVATIMAGVANILQVIVYLALYPDPTTSHREAYFDTTVTLFVISTVFIIVVRVIKRKETPLSLNILDIGRPAGLGTVVHSGSSSRNQSIHMEEIKGTSRIGRSTAPLLAFPQDSSISSPSSRRGSPSGLSPRTGSDEHKRHSRGSRGGDEKRGGSGTITIQVKDDSPRSSATGTGLGTSVRRDSPRDGRPRKDSPKDRAAAAAGGGRDSPKRDSPGGSKRDSPAGSKRDSPAGSKRDSPNQSQGSSRTTSSHGSGNVPSGPQPKRDSPNSSRTVSESGSGSVVTAGTESPKRGVSRTHSTSVSGREAEGDSRSGTRPSSRTTSVQSNGEGDPSSRLGRAVPLSRNPSLGEGDASSRGPSRPLSRTVSAQSGEGDSRPGSRTTSARTMSGADIIPPPPGDITGTDGASSRGRTRTSSRTNSGVPSIVIGGLTGQGAGAPLPGLRPVSMDRTESGSSSRSSHSSRDGEGDSRTPTRVAMLRTESGGRSQTPPLGATVSPPTPTRTVSGSSHQGVGAPAAAPFVLPPPTSSARPSRAVSDARGSTSPRLAATSPTRTATPPLNPLADPTNLDLTSESPKKPGDEF